MKAMFLTAETTDKTNNRTQQQTQGNRKNNRQTTITHQFMDIDLLTVALSRDGPTTIGGVWFKKEGKAKRRKSEKEKRRKSEKEKEAKKGRARV